MLTVKISKDDLKAAFVGQISEDSREITEDISSEKLPDLDLILLQIMLETYDNGNIKEVA